MLSLLVWEMYDKITNGIRISLMLWRGKSMKKIIVIGRPFSNGGDFLIYDRMMKVLKAEYPDAAITLNLDNDGQFDIEELNQYDVIVTGGGGAQFSEAHIRTSFIYQHFDELTVPVHYMGTGLYGADGADSTIYEYRYSDEMITYFNKVLERGGQLAPRDWVVDTVFRNNGIKGAVMAGCPAWYDLETLGNTSKKFKMPKDVKCIAVSNHGLTKNAEEHETKLKQIEDLIEFLQKTYQNAKVLLTFNDGYITKYSRNYNLKLQEWALAHGVECVDLASDAAKFEALDEIDFHVGFRVHTHIYCLSRKIPSILIEEDIRGYGMNETLHLPHLTSYSQVKEEEGFVSNPYLIPQIDVLLGQMKCGRIDYEAVYRIIREHFDNGMRTWLRNL